MMVFFPNADRVYRRGKRWAEQFDVMDGAGECGRQAHWPLRAISAPRGLDSL